MWASLLLSRLPSLSYQLWVAACLASLLPVGLAFYVAVKLRKLNVLREKTNEMSGSLGWNAIVLRLASFRQTDARRMLAVLAIASFSAFAIMRLAAQQRGYCTPASDISHSDHFTVNAKISANCYQVIGKDGSFYDFCINPTTPTDWQPGTFIEFADYEFRDGYADFTAPGAKYKKWPNQEAYDVSRRR